MSTISSKDDIRAVVAIDFGTTFSGYAYAHVLNPEDIAVEDKWGGSVGFKTPTIIKYQDGAVKSWGSLALSKPRSADQSKPIKLFKLFLLNDPSMKLHVPVLPDNLDYKQVISDYLKELGKMIKRQVEGQCLDFYNQILIVLTVPIEFDDDAIAIMRDCANAELMKEKDSRHLIFITEPEAAAIHCLDTLENLHNLKPGDSFMVVDCGGGTVDLACLELLANNRISEITEPTGETCGSSFIDAKFAEFLSHKLGKSTFELFEKENYNSLQSIIQEFIERAKIPFTGQKSDFKSFEIYLEDYNLRERPLTLKDIVKEGKEKQQLEDDDWSIYVEFDDVKRMFDPFIAKIIQLIKGQLDQLQLQNKKCSAMMLVGGFGGSKYLQARIGEVFNKIVPIISVPKIPEIAVLKGAVQFGLKPKTMVKRVLKRTYGTNVLRRSLPGDPSSAILPNGYSIVFESLAKRGKQISVDENEVRDFKLSSPTQRIINFNIYVTNESDAKFCNGPEVSLLRHLEIELPENDDDDDYDEIVVSLSLTFGTVEILATAKNKKTGEKYRINKKTRERLEYEYE